MSFQMHKAENFIIISLMRLEKGMCIGSMIPIDLEALSESILLQLQKFIKFREVFLLLLWKISRFYLNKERRHIFLYILM